MKSSLELYRSFIALAILCILLPAFTYTPQPEPGPKWEVPAKFKNMKNPYKDADLNKTGMELWVRDCKSCHGTKGLGDGAKAKALNTSVGDLSTEKFQSQTDGEIFYKFVYGRDEMPSFEKKITDEEDRWSLVNYMRTFKK
jgi:mono/diheme cytochrome c family protein